MVKTKDACKGNRTDYSPGMLIVTIRKYFRVKLKYLFVC